jgi:phage shock protein PspC (stress-responsive transcriptional regulator)
MCTTRLIHHILIYVIILIILGQVYKLRCSSLFNFLQPPSISSPFSRKYFPQNHVFNHSPSIVRLLVSESKFHTHTKLVTIIVLYILIFMFLDSRREDRKNILD